MIDFDNSIHNANVPWGYLVIQAPSRKCSIMTADMLIRLMIPCSVRTSYDVQFLDPSSRLSSRLLLLKNCLLLLALLSLDFILEWICEKFML